ncbi:hypothetical protein VM1G_11046 [Cytospora mali]|nr:hypothetical protein VM1G_11046 [Valsa mali]
MDYVDFFPPPPDEDHFNKYPGDRWPAEKFEMDIDDLYNALPREFNCMTIPILDRFAFSKDVNDISHKAHDESEFRSLLKERMQHRRKELVDLLLKSLNEIAGNPNVVLKVNDEANWMSMMQIYHSKSFDAYVRHFAEYACGDDEPQICNQDQPQSTSSNTPKGSAVSSDDPISSSVPPSAPSPQTKSHARPTPGPRQAQGSRARPPTHRRKQATIRSTDGIQKARFSGTKSLRRSSRLLEKRYHLNDDRVRTRSSHQAQQEGESHKQCNHQPPPTRLRGDTGKRKRGQEEHCNIEPSTFNTQEQQSNKRRKTDNVRSTTLDRKRKHRPEEDDLQNLQNTAETGRQGTKKRKGDPKTADAYETKGLRSRRGPASQVKDHMNTPRPGQAAMSGTTRTGRATITGRSRRSPRKKPEAETRTASL